MFEFTKNNHFKFGYQKSNQQPDWFCNRTSPTDIFVCEYGRAESKLDFRSANVYAAQYISKIATDDISIMMSGGSDSEITAWAFLDAGVPFRAAVLRFDGGSNQHDINYAIEFCKRHNIHIDFYHLDVQKHLLEGNDFENTVRRYQTTCERATTLWLAEKIPNFAILGQGEPVVTKSFNKWWFQEKERVCSWNKFWIFNNIPGIPGFHQFSPEQILSCITDEMVLELVDGKTAHWSNEQIKHLFYQKHYPEFKIRTKFTGFEKLSNINLPIRNRILATFPYFIGEWKVPYDQAVDNLSPV